MSLNVMKPTIWQIKQNLTPNKTGPPKKKKEEKKEYA